MSVVGLVNFLGCGQQGYLFEPNYTAGFSRTHYRFNVDSHKIPYTRPSAPDEWTHCVSGYVDKLDGRIRGYTAQHIQVIKDAEDMGWTKQDVHGSLTDVDIDMGNAIKEWKSKCGRARYPDTSAQYLEDKAALFALFSREKSIVEAQTPYTNVFS